MQNYLPSTTRINANASYIPADANWELVFAVRNLTDEEDITATDLNAGLGNAIFNVPARGREAFVQHKYSFGDN